MPLFNSDDSALQKAATGFLQALTDLVKVGTQLAQKAVDAPPAKPTRPPFS